MSVESVKYGDICDKCAHAEYCDMATFGGHNPKITACSKFTERHQSNSDRIRAMTDEELADWLNAVLTSNVAPYATVRGANKRGKLLDWMKQEATDGT